MALNLDPMSKLREYSAKLKETDYDLAQTHGEEDYEARINRTLQSLQNQVKQLKDALEKVPIPRVILDNPTSY